MRYRHIDSRPANDDGSIRAEGYFLFDVVPTYAQPRFQIGATAEKLLNIQCYQAQFATLSRLSGEPVSGVNELHFTQGTPIYLKVNSSIFILGRFR